MQRNRALVIKEIGDIGEKLVQHSLLNFHKDVTLSENKFDSEKDMTADGESVEVKTLVKIMKYDGFCIGSNQIVKCLNVDRLFFVQIARGDSINIYESKKPRKPLKKFYNGDNCYFFKLTELELYDTIYDRATADRLRELTPSKYL